MDGSRPGTVDLTFDFGKRAPIMSLIDSVIPVEDLALLPAGRIYVGGHLGIIQGILRDGIARLLPDGRLDPSFREHSPEFNLSLDVHRLLLLPDGRLFAGWGPDQRFLQDGTGDTSWKGLEPV